MIERHDAAREELAVRAEVMYLRALHAVAVRDRDEGSAAALRLQLAEAGMELDRRLHDGVDLGGPMAALAHRFDWTVAQLDLVWAIVLASWDPRLAIPLEALWPGRRGLAIATHEHVRGLNAVTARELALWLGQRNPLVDAGLVVASDPAAPIATRSYVAAPRFLAYLAGDDRPDVGSRRVEPPNALVLDAAQRATLDELARVLAGPPAIVVLEGPRGTGRTTAIASASGGAVIALDVARDAANLPALVRETVLGVGVPVLANADRVPPELGLGRILDGISGHVAVTTSLANVELGATRPIVRLRWSVPDATVRRRLWERAAEGATGDLDGLAHRYRIGAGTIARAVASARAATGRDRLDAADLATGLRHNVSEDLGGLVTPVTVTQGWTDLVLNDDTRAQIAALVARIRHATTVLRDWRYGSKVARGTGVPALFSGPPGTGKTMVAGLIAKELGLELYQVDLSQVTSKWIGETEKQLGKVFDAAEQGHALLLFDEADALFGRRTQDVKGATDRYANMEVNFLLQRVEAFNGITILTTNLDTAIDAALKRRLAAHVVFELPDEAERATLWKRNVDTGAAPLARDLDYDALARRFAKMSGANIRNAALAAAFQAAAEGVSVNPSLEPGSSSNTVITHEHLERAARSEYRSMGHVL